MFRHARIVAAALALVALSACSPPTPPEEERRPEPQAQPAASAVVGQANAYKDAARNAASAVQDQAQRERAQIDAATP